MEKRYGAVWALRNLTLTIAAGECVAVTGRNGSGKTTLLRVAAQLIRPTRGTLTYSGGEDGQRQRIGFVAHATMFAQAFQKQWSVVAQQGGGSGHAKFPFALTS